MTVASQVAESATPPDTFERIKHQFKAPGQVEKAVDRIAPNERVLLFRGSDSDIVKRLSIYDSVQDTQSEAAWRLEVRDLLDALLKQTQAPVQQCFSKGGSRWADRVLASLEIVECVGNKLDPIVVSDSAPAARAFDFSQYGNEDAGNLDLLEHHQAELVKFGVKFGRNAFTMFDLHEHRDLYPIVHDGEEFCGDLDGGIAPFGLSAASAAYQLRVAYKHKQSGAQKQRYRERHGDVAQGQIPAGALTYSGSEKGESVMTTLGAYAYNAWPLLLDLTDGEVHHLIMIRHGELMYWDDLTPQQAYVKQSEMLLSSATLVNRNLRTASLPDDLQHPLKKLRELRIESGLLEQLNDIVPDLPCEERLSASYDIISAWSHLHPIVLPPSTAELSRQLSLQHVGTTCTKP